MTTEKHDPWALLREARNFMRQAAIARGPCPDCTECDHRDAIIAKADGHAREDVPALLAEVERLRDAHAMAVQVSGELCEKCGWAMRFPGEKCRCELLAEVERLTADPLPAAAWVREVERAAFQRGVAAMREAAAHKIASYTIKVMDPFGNVGTVVEDPMHILVAEIRALPDPEDKS